MGKRGSAVTNYHAVQFYKDENSLAATAAGFLAEGIEMAQPALVVATASHTAHIVAALKLKGLDVAALKRTGELNMFDARKMLSSFMVGRMPDPLLFKSNVGDAIDRLCVHRRPSPIRAYGEMVDLLWQDGNAEGAIRLEILWNQLASHYEFALLCGYAVGHFYKEGVGMRFQEVCDQHSHVVPSV